MKPQLPEDESMQYADLLDRLRRLENAQSAQFEPGDLKISAIVVPTVGWVLCDGTSYLRIGAMAVLFAAIGGAASTWGLPDATHFKVPDLRGRMPIGAGTGTGLTARTLGSMVGTEPANMPSHSHGGSTSGGGTPDHAHVGPSGWYFALTDGGVGGQTGATMYTVSTYSGVTGGSDRSLSHDHVISPEGGGASNVPPAQVVNWFIKT